LGTPAFDCCDLLVVHVARIRQAEDVGGPPVAARLPRGVALLYVDMTLSVVRCVPTFTGQAGFPGATALDHSAESAYADAWSVVNGLRERVREGTLFPDPPCRETQVLPALPFDNQGGCGGWSIGVSTQLDGYHP
jgi:hypothetical protein